MPFLRPFRLFRDEKKDKGVRGGQKKLVAGVIFMMDCFLRKDNRRSYLALILNHSRPHFFWDFGSGPVSLSAETPSVASWTAVKFTMTSSAANMHLNENAAGSRSFKAEGEQFAFGNCSVFLGGVPDAHLLPKELQHHANAFAGEIKQLTINERPFQLHQKHKLELNLCRLAKKSPSLSRIPRISDTDAVTKEIRK
ncbi:hypothetical protein NECAME_14777 [Necator americanus]|uniref:Laminin G domain-containing protein n=1 Tax=Necator americanus TaxID=51031 RepID=W2SNJ1_NECAM|nr:hypothetical protein NECAME_14777 [Necator americanus]ETN70421.1 hypothetical protein NECAME_14777 [Necator americanus]